MVTRSFVTLGGQIQDAGFEILANEERTLTEAEAQDLYQHRSSEVNQVYNPDLRKADVQGRAEQRCPLDKNIYPAQY